MRLFRFTANILAVAFLAAPARATPNPSRANYYERLGVDPSATQEEIRAVYRAAARDFHPDRAGPEAKEAAQRINEAYATLRDEKKRSDYDRLIGIVPAKPRGYIREVASYGEAVVGATVRNHLNGEVGLVNAVYSDGTVLYSVVTSEGGLRYGRVPVDGATFNVKMAGCSGVWAGIWNKIRRRR